MHVDTGGYSVAELSRCGNLYAVPSLTGLLPLTIDGCFKPAVFILYLVLSQKRFDGARFRTGKIPRSGHHLYTTIEFLVALPGLEPGQGNDAFTGYEPGEIPISPERVENEKFKFAPRERLELPVVDLQSRCFTN